MSLAAKASITSFGDLTIRSLVTFDIKLPFYVYLYRDSRRSKRGVPIYVGKGHDTLKKPNQARSRCHWREPNRIRHNPILQAIFAKMRKEGVSPRIEIIARFKSENEAFAFETALIKKFGRRNLGTGTLCNLTDGGEGPSGTLVSLETREKLRKTTFAYASQPHIRQRVSEMSARLHQDEDFLKKKSASLRASLNTPESLAERSAFLKEVHARPGEKEKRSAALKAVLASPEARARKSRAAIACQNRPEVKKRHRDGLLRRWRKDGAKQQMSERMKALWADPEYKAQRLAAAARRKHKKVQADE